MHKIQVLVYKKLLDDLKEGLYGYKNFEMAYHIRSLTLTEEFKRQLDAIKIDAYTGRAVRCKEHFSIR